MSYHGDSLGSLIDRLTILNLKLWHVQEKVHAAERTRSGLDPESTRALVSLNRDRNRTMTEIDRCLAEAVTSGKVTVDERYKTS